MTRRDWDGSTSDIDEDFQKTLGPGPDLICAGQA